MSKWKEGYDENQFNKDCVDFHNELRSEVAQGKAQGHSGKLPKASGMNKVRHSAALAKVATTFAEKVCSDGKGWVEHNSGRTSQFGKLMKDNPAMQDMTFKYKEGIYVGENAWMGGGKEAVDSAGLKDMIQAWYNEIKDYDYPNGAFGVVGHFTQVTHEKVRWIGCGFAICDGQFGPEQWSNDIWASYFICNYVSGQGSPPYKDGSVCSTCDSDRGSSCTDGLCDGCMAPDFYVNPDAKADSGCDPRGQEAMALQGYKFPDIEGPPCKVGGLSCYVLAAIIVMIVLLLAAAGIFLLKKYKGRFGKYGQMERVADGPERNEIKMKERPAPKKREAEGPKRIDISID